MDWASRKVLSWRLSNTLETDFCVDALQEALSRFGSPEIFNTDQRAQFTSEGFTEGPTIEGSASAWTARAAGLTMSSSNGCDEA